MDVGIFKYEPEKTADSEKVWILTRTRRLAVSRDRIKLFLAAPKGHHFFPGRELGPKLRHAKTRTREAWGYKKGKAELCYRVIQPKWQF